MLPDCVMYTSPAELLGAFSRGGDASAGSVLAAVSTANNHSVDLGLRGRARRRPPSTVFTDAS